MTAMVELRRIDLVCESECVAPATVTVAILAGAGEDVEDLEVGQFCEPCGQRVKRSIELEQMGPPHG